jgi:hypothetical protein
MRVQPVGNDGRTFVILSSRGWSGVKSHRNVENHRYERFPESYKTSSILDSRISSRVRPCNPQKFPANMYWKSIVALCAIAAVSASPVRLSKSIDLQRFRNFASLRLKRGNAQVEASLFPHLQVVLLQASLALFQLSVSHPALRQYRLSLAHSRSRPQ